MSRSRCSLSEAARCTPAGAAWLLAGLLLLLACFPSGADEGKSVVATGEGWALTSPQVAAEYDRRHGTGAFALLSAEHRSRFLETVVQKELLLREARAAMSDSLRAAAGLRVQPEAAVAAGEAIAGCLDSLVAALPPGRDLDRWALRPPVWRLSPGQRESAIAELRGRPYTLAEFFASLETADDRYWPRLPGDRARIHDVQRRLDRLVQAEAAVARGLDRAPPYLEVRERLEGEALLDSWYEQVLLPAARVTPAETEAMLTRDLGRWKVPERVEFAAVVFPDGLEAEAERFRDQVAGADASRWTEEAERALENVDGVQFIPTSDLLDVGRPPEPVSWTPLLRAAAGLAEPGVTGPVPAPELGGVASSASSSARPRGRSRRRLRARWPSGKSACRKRRRSSPPGSGARRPRPESACGRSGRGERSAEGGRRSHGIARRPIDGRRGGRMTEGATAE